MQESSRKAEQLWRHITEVQRNCYTLGMRLMGDGEAGLGQRLIANSLAHDQSKFHGIEWDFIASGEDVAKADLDRAIEQHNRTNAHHPEYWNGIRNMPEIYIAEMVADWKARSSEFGTSLQEWIDGAAAKRFGYKKREKVYRTIMRFTRLLLERPFSAPQ